MLSASNADRVVACPASDALPQIRETNEAAQRGNAIHEFLQAVCMHPDKRAEHLAKVPDEHRPICETLDVAEAVRGLSIVGVEMAYALDVKAHTVRFVGSNIGRNYGPLGPYEIPCTLDVEATRDGEPVELDWKTGQDMGDVENLWQRRICATVLLFKYDAVQAHSRNVYVRDGYTYPSDYTFSITEALGYCDELATAIRRRNAAASLVEQGRVPDVYPNTEKQCRYCPARDTCPATTALIRSFAQTLAPTGLADADTVLARLDVMSEEEQGHALGIVKEVVRLGELAKKRLTERAKVTALPAGDGYEWRGVEKVREYFDADAARGLLIRLGAGPEQLVKLNKKTHYKEVRKVKI